MERQEPTKTSRAAEGSKNRIRFASAKFRSKTATADVYRGSSAPGEKRVHHQGIDGADENGDRTVVTRRKRKKRRGHVEGDDDEEEES